MQDIYLKCNCLPKNHSKWPTAFVTNCKTLFKKLKVFTKNDSFFFETTPLTDIVNTNGAGDGFAGGFLAFYLKNESLETCVLMGQKVAQGVLNTDLSYLPNKIEF